MFLNNSLLSGNYLWGWGDTIHDVQLWLCGVLQPVSMLFLCGIWPKQREAVDPMLHPTIHPFKQRNETYRICPMNEKTKPMLFRIQFNQRKLRRRNLSCFFLSGVNMINDPDLCGASHAAMLARPRERGWHVVQPEGVGVLWFLCLYMGHHIRLGWSYLYQNTSAKLPITTRQGRWVGVRMKSGKER